MSTRATYSFENVTYYIHYDGYPEGAAQYIQAALLADGRGGLQSQFLRANELAEITESHGIHGDTEYRYTFSKDRVVAEKEVKDRDGEFQVFFNGTVYEFINIYTDATADKWVQVSVSQHGILYKRFVNKEKLENIFRKRQDELVDYVKRGFTLDNPNLTYAQKDCAQIKEVLVKEFKAVLG